MKRLLLLLTSGIWKGLSTTGQRGMDSFQEVFTSQKASILLPIQLFFLGFLAQIGDMDLREGLFARLYNNLHREIASANSKSTPSTFADWIIGYHRESNFQYEHRDM